MDISNINQDKRISLSPPSSSSLTLLLQYHRKKCLAYQCLIHDFFIVWIISLWRKKSDLKYGNHCMLFFIEKRYQGRVRNIKKSFVHLTWHTLGFSSKCLALSTKNQILYDYFRVYLEPISRLILTVSDTYVGSL